MQVRMKEHEIVTKSVLARHVGTKHHKIEWEQIIIKDDNWYKTKYKETVYVTTNCSIIGELSVDVRKLRKLLRNHQAQPHIQV